MGKVNKAGERMNFALAAAIYKTLNAKGAGLGNASIHIIEKVLDDNEVQDLPTLEEFKQQANYDNCTATTSEAGAVYEAAFIDCFNWLDKL